MASVVNDPGGRKRILFVDPAGDRKGVRLGKASQRAAEGVAFRIEQLLAAKMTGQPKQALYRRLMDLKDG